MLALRNVRLRRYYVLLLMGLALITALGW